MFGATRFTNSSHFLAIEGSKFVNPVRLPPGRARLCTTPAVTGSLSCTNTVGVVRVVSLTAAATGVGLARITSEPVLLGHPQFPSTRQLVARDQAAAHLQRAATRLPRRPEEL